MGKLLFDSSPKVFNQEAAELYGLQESILLQQFHYWNENKLKHPDRFQDTFIHGYFWVYKTVAEIHAEMPYLGSERQIKRMISTLQERGVLIVEKLAANTRNRTNYYRVNYEQIDADEKALLSQCKVTECPDATGQIGTMERAKLAQCSIKPKKTTKTTTNTNGNCDENSISAEQFWTIYKRKPGKGSKEKFSKAWAKLTSDEKQQALEHYNKLCKHFSDWRDGTQYAAQPLTFVNQKYWTFDVGWDSGDLLKPQSSAHRNIGPGAPVETVDNKPLSKTEQIRRQNAAVRERFRQQAAQATHARAEIIEGEVIG